MDILLLVITVVSVGVALVMGIAAWGVWKEERARSAARVALLTAAARDAAPALSPSVPWPAQVRQPHPVASSTEPAAERILRPAPAARNAGVAAVGASFLGSGAAAPAGSGRQGGLAIAAGVLLALLAAGYFIVGGDNAATAAATEAAPTAAAPLELVALRHERQGGSLTISGLVRNPNAGRTVEALNAVVFLFDQQGALLASSRAGVDYRQLTPGGESPFVIRVTAPSTVARYRVSFRTDAGVVAHIDRRGQAPLARELP